MSSMLLYQNVGPYFFESCKGLAYPILKESRFFQKLYRYIRRLGRPRLTSLCYGEWTSRLSDITEVFILDSAFDWSLPAYISKRNPNAKMTLLFWNPIKDNELRIIEAFKGHGTIASYNKDDCRKYNLELIESFYSKGFVDDFDQNVVENDILFLGRDKGRAQSLSKLASSLRAEGLKCRFLILGNQDIAHPALETLTETIPYSAYCEEVKKTCAILDIAQAGVDALNLRVMEALFFQKKLITNNQSIEKYSFFRPENIYVIKDDTHTEDIIRFMKQPFSPYPNDVIDQFDIYTVLPCEQPYQL